MSEMEPKTAPYGTWPSPISTDALVQKNTPILDVRVDPVSRKVYHLERRPAEGGRAVVVDTATRADVFGAGWNATSRAHEYGGAAALVYNDVLYFSNRVDDRVYCLQLDGRSVPEAVSPADVPWRYADFAVHPKQTNILVSILEDHTHDTPQTVLNRLCIINTSTKSVSTLIEGANFYAQPLFAPDGTHLVFQSWNHPDMPWQRAALHVFRVEEIDMGIALRDEVRIAWDDGHDVSVGYPKWLDEGRLLFLADATGFFNPYIYDLRTKARAPLLSSPLSVDFVITSFRLGASPFDILYDDNKPVAVVFNTIKHGRGALMYFDLALKTLTPIDSAQFVSADPIQAVSSKDLVFISQSTAAPQAVASLHLQDLSRSPISTTYKILKPSMAALDIPASFISQPVSLSLDVGGGKAVHANFYAPTNPDFQGDQTERPPCVVNAHGGPTGMAGAGLNWDKQFFTSRGWAWLDVDYGGSNGYGRQYIDRLTNNWGITDVSDCAHAASALASPPYSLVDPSRLAIRGQSSGGFTALAALCSFPDTFSAGASLFGISDLVKLTEDTHKFESRYMEKLLGGTYEDIPEVYVQRSPVNNAEKIKTPLLILQGLEDKVVPPEQADLIVDKIRAQGGHVEDIRFEGEGHGWRKNATIKAALEAELAFYQRMFKISV